ncbi:MAG: thiamine-phosphate kinase [Candidatus Gastranaerophilales bacterium]|nr:thiamine-phosphate kinase [Candidatus Gastranaerophilales bacterium]
MKEDKFIGLIKNLLPESSKYIGDDTAFIEEKGLILTQDTLVEDVHFRMSTISPYDLGIKSIAVNLSDIAASGGIAEFILISLSLPESVDEDFVKRFYEGVNHICRKYDVVVVGGDLTRATKITISIAAIGFNERLQPAKRSLAKVDDVVITAGEFGSSAAGLWILESKISDISEDISKKFVKAHINPVPLLQEGRTIVKSCETPPALMDASDGLADALYKISLSSGVGMEINYDEIPVDKNLEAVAQKAGINSSKWVLYGGEDYGLVGTVPEFIYEKLLADNIPVKAIGRVLKMENCPEVLIRYNDKIVKINSNTLDSEVFSHFR